MDNSISEKVLNYSAFDTVVKSLEETDPEYGESLVKTLMFSLDAIQEKLNDTETLLEKEYLLFQLGVLLREQMNHQRVRIQSFSVMENEMNVFLYTSAKTFIDSVIADFTQITEGRRKRMIEELMKNSRWSDDLTDSAKRGGNIMIKSTSRIKQKLSNNSNEVMDESTLQTVSEQMIKEHFDVDYLAKILQGSIKKHSTTYEQEWDDLLKEKVLTEADEYPIMKNSILLSSRKGLTTNVAAMGLTTGIAGTVGLAMGWHTLSYSVANVFPPIALFTLFTTVGVGLLNKNKMLEKKKQELLNVVNQYESAVIRSLHHSPQESLDNKSVSDYLIERGQKRVEEVLHQQQQEHLGDISLKQLEQLIEALSLHQNYVEEWLEDVKEGK